MATSEELSPSERSQQSTYNQYLQTLRREVVRTLRPIQRYNELQWLDPSRQPMTLDETLVGAADVMQRRLEALHLNPETSATVSARVVQSPGPFEVIETPTGTVHFDVMYEIVPVRPSSDRRTRRRSEWNSRSESGSDSESDSDDPDMPAAMGTGTTISLRYRRRETPIGDDQGSGRVVRRPSRAPQGGTASSRRTVQIVAVPWEWLSEDERENKDDASSASSSDDTEWGEESNGGGGSRGSGESERGEGSDRSDDIADSDDSESREDGGDGEGEQDEDEGQDSSNGESEEGEVLGEEESEEETGTGEVNPEGSNDEDGTNGRDGERGRGGPREDSEDGARDPRLQNGHFG